MQFSLAYFIKDGLPWTESVCELKHLFYYGCIKLFRVHIILFQLISPYKYFSKAYFLWFHRKPITSGVFLNTHIRCSFQFTFYWNAIRKKTCFIWEDDDAFNVTGIKDSSSYLAVVPSVKCVMKHSLFNKLPLTKSHG